MRKHSLIFTLFLFFSSCSKELNLNDYVGIYEATVTTDGYFYEYTKLKIDNIGGKYYFQCPKNVFTRDIPITSNGSNGFNIDFFDNTIFSSLTYKGTGTFLNNGTLKLVYIETANSNSTRNITILATR